MLIVVVDDVPTIESEISKIPCGEQVNCAPAKEKENENKKNKRKKRNIFFFPKRKNSFSFFLLAELLDFFI